MPIVRSLRLYRWPRRMVHHCKDGIVVSVVLVLWSAIRWGHLYSSKILKMGIVMPETCWAIRKINHCVASSWFYSLRVIDDARSNTRHFGITAITVIKSQWRYSFLGWTIVYFPFLCTLLPTATWFPVNYRIFALWDIRTSYHSIRKAAEPYMDICISCHKAIHSWRPTKLIIL